LEVYHVIREPLALKYCAVTHMKTKLLYLAGLFLLSAFRLFLE